MVCFLLPERVLTRRSRQWWFTLLHGPPLDAAASNPAGFITSTMYKSTVRVMLKKASPGAVFIEISRVGWQKERAWVGDDKCGRPKNQVREEFSSSGLNKIAHLKMSSVQSGCNELLLLENIYFNY